jgi:hypothetical protein
MLLPLQAGTTDGLHRSVDRPIFPVDTPTHRIDVFDHGGQEVRRRIADAVTFDYAGGCGHHMWII